MMEAKDGEGASVTERDRSQCTSQFFLFKIRYRSRATRGHIMKFYPPLKGKYFCHPSSSRVMGDIWSITYRFSSGTARGQGVAALSGTDRPEPATETPGCSFAPVFASPLVQLSPPASMAPTAIEYIVTYDPTQRISQQSSPSYQQQVLSTYAQSYPA